MSTFFGQGSEGDSLAFGGTITGSLDITQSLTVGDDIKCASLQATGEIDCDTLVANTYIVVEDLEVKNATITMNAGAVDNSNATSLLFEFKDAGISKWSGIGREPTDGDFYAFRDAATKPDQSTDLTALTGQRMHADIYTAESLVEIGPTVPTAARFEYGTGDDLATALLIKADSRLIMSLSSILTPNPRVDVPVMFEAYNTASISRTGTDPALLRWLDDRHAVSPLFTLGLEAGDATKFLKLKNTAGNAVLQADPATDNIVLGTSSSVVGANGAWGFNQGPITIIDNAPSSSTAGILLSDNPASITWRIGHNNGGSTDDFAIWKGSNVTRAMLIDSATTTTTMRDIILDKQAATDVAITLKRNNAQVVKWGTTGANSSILYNSGNGQFLNMDVGSGVISNYIDWSQNGVMNWKTAGGSGTGQFIQEATTTANQLRFKTFTGGNNIMYLTNDGNRNTVMHAPVVCNQAGGTTTLKFQSAPSTDKTFFFQMASELRVDDVGGAHYIGLDQTTKKLFVYTGLRVGVGAPSTAWDMPNARATTAGQVLVDLSVAGTPVWGQGTLAATLSDVAISGPAAGDTLAYNAGTSKWVNQAPVLTGKWDFAGDASTTGGSAVYLNAGGSTTAVLFAAASEINSYVVPVACTLIAMTYFSAVGDTSSNLSIYKNGVAAFTFNLPTNTSGNQALALSFAAGDVLNLRWNAVGTTPGNMNAQIYFRGT